MSWSQRLSQLSGRWSPFARSPNAENGPTQVNDADFSYITTEDLRNGAYDRDSAPSRETDLLTFKNKRTLYPVHFPVYSIDRGELTIGDIREQAAKKIGCDVKRLKLLYKGKTLKDDGRTCREDGLREGIEIMCVASEGTVEPPSSSESEDEEEAIDGDGDGVTEGQPKRRRNRNRNKKKKNKRRGDAGEADHLAVPGSECSRTASPIPPSTPATPLEKLNALDRTLQSLMPQCDDFIAQPPSEPSKREFEHKRLSETILAQVLIKLDGVETDDVDARARRKELVREAQRVLNALDAAK
ncbi:hypothetical protein ANO11243_027680 [Dothideomycetidae sp. 11243]|nr:hypothetical protein ANO11243_027680 [fungal sp. No.11243]